VHAGVGESSLAEEGADGLVVTLGGELGSPCADRCVDARDEFAIRWIEELEDDAIGDRRASERIENGMRVGLAAVAEIADEEDRCARDRRELENLRGDSVR